MKRIKSKSDFILGIIMLVISLYLLFSQHIVKGLTLLYTNIPIAKADTYVRILGGCLCLLSAGLLLRTLGVFGGAKETGKAEDREEKPAEKKGVDWLVIAGFIALVIYVPLMQVIGFIASSILLIAFFSFIIRAREKKVDRHDKKAILKDLIISLLYAAILVLVLCFVFTTWLNVRLP